MPYQNSYTKTDNFKIDGSSTKPSITYDNSYTSTGNERRLVNESIPAGAVNSGLVFNFNVASGTFLGFSSNGPLVISGAGWNYKITLTGTSSFNSWFVRTGFGLWGSTEGLIPQNASGTLYVSNPGASPIILNVESLSDINNNWGVGSPQ